MEFRTRDGVARAVDGVSYAVRSGQTLAVLGESGSGKSVTAHAVMGILDTPPARVTGGQVLFRGRDLLTLPEEERRRIRGAQLAMIFQDALSALNPVLTVGAQLGEMFEVHHGFSRREAGPAPSPSWTASASPAPAPARATTRTSSPAACASAS